jgi:hypothetical protein
VPAVIQARCQLGNKYGALMEDCAGLLATAQQLNIKVVGVAFHVGSGATNPQAFADAIAAARLVSHHCPCFHIFNDTIAAACLVNGHRSHACTLSMTRLSRQSNIDMRDPINCCFSMCPSCLWCGSLGQIIIVLSVLSVQLAD